MNTIKYSTCLFLKVKRCDCKNYNIFLKIALINVCHSVQLAHFTFVLIALINFFH